MTLPTTLLFPDTALCFPDQLALLLPFAPVHVVKVVEDERPDESCADIFMDDGFCQALVPHPLQSDRKRFLNLIDDIKNRKDDYAAQLSALTLASLSTRKQQENESRQQIISSLVGNSAATADSTRAEERESLWHARLILKIGEMLDREEYEVARALASLEENEAAIFTSLKGQEEDEEGENIYSSLNTRLGKVSKPPPDSIKKRLQAWFRFIRGAGLPPCRIWSTIRQEAADILFEAHHSRHETLPEMLGALALPAGLADRKGKLTESLAAFRSQSAQHLGLFFDRVLTSASAESVQQGLSSFYPEWQAWLEDSYPAAEYGRMQLQLYGFRETLGSYCGLKGEDGGNHARILALLIAIE